MNKSSLIASAAILGLLAAPALAHADNAMPEGKEKCYGVAKAGQNDCTSADGSHGCGGHSKVDNDPNEWKMVDAGSCDGMGGKTSAPEAAE